jgi:hypothetical protein
MTSIETRTAAPDKPVPPCPPWCTARPVDAWDWVVVRQGGQADGATRSASWRALSCA